MTTSVQMPQLILGHLPFLAESYQGELRNREYVGRFSKIENTVRILTRAVEEYGITVLGAAPACESQLAGQLLEAVRVVIQWTGRKLSLIPCLRIPLTIEGWQIPCPICEILDLGTCRLVALVHVETLLSA
jgi:hypothetical protein